MDLSASQKRETVPDALKEAAIENICQECGAVGAVEIGHRWLCQNCYAEAGSCCLEFGANDLWDLGEAKPV